MKKIYFIISLVILLTSCETREDINMKRNKSPEVFISTEKTGDYVIELADTLKYSEETIYYYKSSDDSKLNLVHTVDLEFIGENSGIKDSVVVSLNSNTNEILVQTKLNDKTINSKSYSFNLYVMTTDNYGLTSKAKISITLIENRPPVPQVIFNQISNTEYEISANGSVDSDGDKIVSYEYLIDGKIIYNKPGYEGEYESIANPNPGHAATEGTYIISTPLSSIKHNFQVENVSDFKIYVRVKDSRGLWSAWGLFTL